MFQGRRLWQIAKGPLHVEVIAPALVERHQVATQRPQCDSLPQNIDDWLLMLILHMYLSRIMYI